MHRTIIKLLILFPILNFSQVDPNLLLHYKFDGNTLDSSTYGHHGTAFGPNLVSDRAGNPNSAYYFDGIDDYINFPNIAELKVPLPVSFSFWIKYDGADYQDHVVFNTSMEENHATSVVFNAQSGSNKYVINYADGQYYYGPESRRSYVSNSVIENQNWHSVVIVVNSAYDMKIYVDCVESGGEYSGEGGPLAYSSQPGCIGRHDRSLSQPIDYFKGFIDDFKYWSRALNEIDVEKLCDPTLLSNTEPAVERAFIIYPNPVTNLINVVESFPVEKYVLYNSIGQEVLQQYNAPIYVDHLPSGIYNLMILSQTAKEVKRVVIK